MKKYRGNATVHLHYVITKYDPTSLRPNISVKQMNEYKKLYQNH